MSRHQALGLYFFVALADPAGLQHRGGAQKGDPGGQADRPQAHHGGGAVREERRQRKREGQRRGKE